MTNQTNWRVENPPNCIRTDIDEAKAKFMDEWDKGHNPTLQQYITAYPDHAQEMTDFILDYIERMNAVN